MWIWIAALAAVILLGYKLLPNFYALKGNFAYEKGGIGEAVKEYEKAYKTNRASAAIRLSYADLVLRDGRFLYTVMEALWQPDAPKLTPGQQYFSPALLEYPGEKVPEYYRQVMLRLNRAVTGQGENADPEMVAALQELQTLSFKEETT